MKTKDIKKSINQEMECLISSDFDSVISKIEQKKGVIIEMENPKRKKTKIWGLSLSLAALVILIVGIFSFNSTSKETTVLLATIIFDVNPSVEIKVDKNERVLEIVAHNEDAKKVVGDMDLTGVELDVATNAVLGSMLKNGYIDEAKNSVLVTVVGADETKNKELQERVAGDIDNYFASNNVNGSVMSQIVNSNEDLESLAQQHGITVGKAELINKIVAANPMYTFEDLVKLSTTELNLLSNSNKNNVTTVKTSGTASEKNYIGKDKAKEIAFNKAGVKENNVTGLEIELDLDNGVMVYDVEFYSNSYEYDYEINAIDGTILKADKDTDFDKKNNNTNNNNNNSNLTNNKLENNTTSDGYISNAKAKEIALNHAGVKEYYDYDIEFDYDYGYATYEIDFETDTKEYEYAINAKTGEIIHSNVESADDKKSTNANSSSKQNASTSNSSSLITKGKAKSIALNHAGISSGYYDVDVELDNEGGVKVYEIDFETKDYEYEYTINAKTGKIIKSEKERND